MKFNVTFKENNEKIDLHFKEANVISDGGFERGYAQGKAQGELDGYIKGNSDGHQLGLLQGFENAKTKLGGIEITENGEYSPNSDIIGFNSVKVNVVAKSKLSIFLQDTEPYDITEQDLSGITSLSEYSFRNKLNLRKLEIPSNITTNIKRNSLQGSSCEELVMNGNGAVGYAFEKTSLKKVYWNASSIPTYCFDNCLELTDVELSEKVTSLGSSAFNYCSALTNIDLRNTNITTIGSNCFYNCTELKEIYIPKTVTSMVYHAFMNCKKMEHIYYNANINDYSSSFYGNFTVTSTSNTSSVADNMSTVLHIEKDCKIIPAYAFRAYYRYSSSSTYVCYIHSLVFEEDTICEKINIRAFENNKYFENITFPKSLKNIATRAFNSCVNLKTIKLTSDTPPTIANDSFYGVTFEKIIVPKGKLEIYKSATNWSALASYMEEEVE